MVERKPIVVEMTGIFGAGYLPGLFNPLKSMIQENFLWLNDDKPESLMANYHIDNTAAIKRNPQRRNRIADLIEKAPNLNLDEWAEFVDSLEWADELFEENLKSYPSNVVFRRGGRLQNWIHLRGNRWEEANINRRKPKLPVFLTATSPAIKQTFEQNQEVRKIIGQSPESFCNSPERALELQEEWHKRVEDYPGLICIERQPASKEEFANDEFAREIIKPIIPRLDSYGLKTMIKIKVFISYSSKDGWFADKLENALNRKGIGVWIDKKEIVVGDDLIEKIREGVNTSQYICAVISNNSINSRWVREELNLGMNQQIESGEVKVLPLILESGLEMPSFLKGKSHIDFSKEDFDKCVDNLMRRLKS